MQQVRTAREIKPRPIELSFTAAPKEWIAQDPFTTSLLNALSLTFPDGERFFVAAVRALRDGIGEPVLKAQIKGFLAQEALHRREHDRFNQHLKTQGIDTDRFYAEIAAILARPERNLPPLGRLAITCALEHFTAIMAESLLTSPALLEKADPEVRALWQWHAIEELDHKAVAFDLFRAKGGGYALRVTTMMGATVVFIAKVSEMHARLLSQSGALNARVVLSGLWQAWGPGGYFSRLLPAYLRYYKPSFHPNDHDSNELIQRFERELPSYDGAQRS